MVRMLPGNRFPETVSENCKCMDLVTENAQYLGPLSFFQVKINIYIYIE